MENFHTRKVKFNFLNMDYTRMEHSLKVLAQIDEDNKNYDFLIKYLKFRMFTKQIIEKRQIEKR